MVVLDTGTAADLPAIVTLLADTGLTTAGLNAVPTRFVVARHGDRLVGVGALERHADDGLLRSLAVDAALRAAGIGSAIAGELERYAASSGVRGTYLLTETAEPFFARRGYRRIGRDQAPAAISVSVEWSTGCGASAIPMVR